MEEKMTGARLVALMREGRQGLEALVSRADRARMDPPSLPDRWSLKDILAHLSWWDRFMIAWIEADAKGEVPDLPAPRMTEEDMDRLNARTYAEQRDRPLEAVLTDFRTSFQTLLAKAEATPEADLLDPDRFAWTGGKPLWFYFAANSYWHYSEHLDQIRELAGATER